MEVAFPPAAWHDEVAEAKDEERAMNYRTKARKTPPRSVTENAAIAACKALYTGTPLPM